MPLSRCQIATLLTRQVKGHLKFFPARKMTRDIYLLDVKSPEEPKPSGFLDKVRNFRGSSSLFGFDRFNLNLFGEDFSELFNFLIGESVALVKVAQGSCPFVIF